MPWDECAWATDGSGNGPSWGIRSFHVTNCYSSYDLEPVTGGGGGNTTPNPPPNFDPCEVGGNWESSINGIKTLTNNNCEEYENPQLEPNPEGAPLNNENYYDINTSESYNYGDIHDFYEDNYSLVDELEQTIPAGDDLTLNLHLITSYYAITKTAEFATESILLKKLHPTWSSARIYSVAFWNVLKREIHFILDVGGLVPVIGEAADVINGGIYYLEGDRINAALSIVSAVPIVGWVSTGGKWTKTAINAIPISSIPVGKELFRAVKNAKGVVRMIKVPFNAFSQNLIKNLPALKPADNTLTNLNRTMVDQFSMRVKPTLQSLKTKIDDIVQNSDIAGTKTETLCDEMFETNGFIKYESKIGSNNGFDGVYIKGDINNPTEIIINEAKQIGSAGNIKLNGRTTNKGPQMSEEWINQTIIEMRTHSNPLIVSLGNTLFHHSSKIIRTVSGVDKTTIEFVVLKLDQY